MTREHELEKALSASVEREEKLREYIECAERMIKDKEMPFTYQEWEKVVARLANDLEESLKDEPGWEKTKDGKWRPKSLNP